MEIQGSFHCRWKWTLPSLSSIITASNNIFRGSFHELPCTPTYFHIVRVSQTSSCSHKTSFQKGPPTSVRSTSMDVPTNFHRKFHGSKFTSMETFTEVSGRIVTSMGISMEDGGSRFTSIEVSRSFHGSTWKFLLSVEVEASIASISCMDIFCGSFHEIPHTPTYFCLLPRVSQTSSCFHKTNRNRNPNPKLELPPWKLVYFQLPWKLVEASMEVAGS